MTTIYIDNNDNFDIIIAMKLHILVCDGVFDLGLAALTDTVGLANAMAGSLPQAPAHILGWGDPAGPAAPQAGPGCQGVATRRMTRGVWYMYGWRPPPNCRKQRLSFGSVIFKSLN
jgi:hypothetical protein